MAKRTDQITDTEMDQEQIAAYRVITDREPCWDGVHQPQNAVIKGQRDDEAIRTMLERGWIEETENG